MTAGEYQRLRGIARRLPFDIEETEVVNTIYLDWRGGGEPYANDVDNQKLVELWTYCWVRRYYLQKLGPEQHHDPAAFDSLVSRTFAKIQQSLRKGTYVKKYAQWVSVICKNTFRNYLKRRNEHFSADSMSGTSPVLVSHQPEEVGFVRQEVSAAIERLPPYLRVPLHERLLGGKSYKQISQETGKDISTIRSYVSKGLKRLRNDSKLLACRGYEER